MSNEGEAPVDRSQPTSVEILAALRDAGWLLEQETASSLQAAGFHSLMGTAFPDPDDPSTSREIDVSGWQQLYRNEEIRLTVGARVIAECKQSNMPYVLIGRSITEQARAADRLEQRYRFSSIEIGRKQVGLSGYQSQGVKARKYLGLDTLEGNPWPSGFVATQMTRLDRKKTWLADNRGIFTSLVYPLAKTLTHFRSLIKGDNSSDHRPDGDWAHTQFFYPLIVTSAPIYIVDVSEPDLEAKQVQWST